MTRPTIRPQLQIPATAESLETNGFFGSPQAMLAAEIGGTVLGGTVLAATLPMVYESNAAKTQLARDEAALASVNTIKGAVQGDIDDTHPESMAFLRSLRNENIQAVAETKQNMPPDIGLGESLGMTAVAGVLGWALTGVAVAAWVSQKSRRNKLARHTPKAAPPQQARTLTIPQSPPQTTSGSVSEIAARQKRQTSDKQQLALGPPRDTEPALGRLFDSRA